MLQVVNCLPTSEYSSEIVRDMSGEIYRLKSVVFSISNHATRVSEYPMPMFPYRRIGIGVNESWSHARKWKIEIPKLLRGAVIFSLMDHEIVIQYF